MIIKYENILILKIKFNNADTMSEPLSFVLVR